MSPSSPERHWIQRLLPALGFALAYVGCAELGHWLSFEVPHRADHFATCWPPTGLFVAILLLVDRRAWPLFLATGLLADNFSNIAFHNRSLAFSLGSSLANAIEAALGAWIVQKMVPPPFAFRRTADVLALTAGAAVLSTAFGSAIAVWIIFTPFDGTSIYEVWYRWWISDMIGVLVVAPLLLVWLPFHRCDLAVCASRCLESAAIFIALAALGWLVFCFHPNFARAFLLFPILIFVAMRFSLKGATAATVLIAFFGIWGTTRGMGLFVTTEPAAMLTRCENLQAFLAAASLTSLLYATSFVERVESDRAKQHHMELLNAVLEGTTDAVFVKDMDGRYLMINEAGARFLGKRAKEVVGKDDTEMFSPASARRVRDIDLEVMKSGETKINEETLTVGEVTRTFLSSKGPYRGSQGELRGLLGISRDISEYRRAVQLLRESEERFQQMANSIPEFFWLRQVEPFGFLYASPAYETITGKSVEGLYRDPFSFLQVIHPDDRQKMTELTIMEVTAPVEAECRALGVNGDVRYMKIRFSPVKNESGKIDRLAGIAIDVTELTLAERKLEQANKKLEEANKDLEHRVHERTAALTETNEKLTLEIQERGRAEEKLQQQQAQLAHVSRLSTIGEMAAELAHEINQPLSAIGNYIYGTLHGLQIGDVVSEDLIATLRQLEIESGRAANIIRRVRSFTRRGDPQREEISLNDSVRGVFRLTSGEARHRNIEMQVKLDEKLPKILVDPLQIEQVIVNLVRNAFDALQEGGYESRVVVLETINRGDTVEVAVHDNGPGLADDARTDF